MGEFFIAPDILSSKQAARTRLRSLRAALSLERRASISVAAVQHLRGSGLLPATGFVALYAAFGDELDPSALEPFVSPVYPRIQGQNLVFVASTRAELVPSPPWNIPEPVGPPVALDQIRLWVVPGLGFGLDGARLGYGRGYYDRVLARRPEGVLTVGFTADALLGPIPVGPNDVPVDVLVTEKGLFWARDWSPDADRVT